MRLEWAEAVSSYGSPVTYTVYVQGQVLCSSIARTSCQTPTMDKARTFEWFVFAQTSTGLTARSTSSTFKTNTPPPAPIPLGPDESARPVARLVDLRVASAADFDGDQISYTADVEDLTTGRTQRVECPGRRCAPALRDGTAYSWRLTAYDGEHATPGPTQFFTTNSPPRKPMLDPGDDGAVQLPLDAPWREPPTTDPDGDSILYSWEIRDAQTGFASSMCAPAATTECLLHFPRHGARYTITYTATDSNGLSSSTLFNVTTRLPVILIHGLNGGDDTWDGLRDELAAEGFDVLDFDATASGIQALEYSPGGRGILRTAAEVVSPAIRRALMENGYDAFQKVDVIGHSMGGLIGRSLIENDGATITGGGLTLTMPRLWDQQVRTLTMLATPNRGSALANSVACEVDLAVPEPWNTSCLHLIEGSAFYDHMGFTAGSFAQRYQILIGTSDWMVSVANAGLDDVEPILVPDACHSRDWGYLDDCVSPIVEDPRVFRWIVNYLALSYA